jgi:cytochrome P450
MKYPPGPRGFQVFGFIKAPLAFLERTAREFGPISCFRLLGQKIYLIDDADLIQEVLITRQHLFVRDNGATFLRELVGDGLLTRDEPAHKERRRALQPAFHRAQVASYAGMMVREAERTAASWQPGNRIELTAEMKRLTLSIVGASLFGADFRTNAERIAEVLGRVIRRGRFIGPAISLLEPPLHAYRRCWPDAPSVFFRKERAELEQILKPVMEQRRLAETGDILSLLLSQLEDRDAANEIVTLVLAGHETTATALTWAWHLLAEHPDVEARMQEELNSVLDGRAPGLEDLPRLSYTGMVFNEAMRLYPPAPAFGRRPKETVSLGGYEIPAGASILLSPYVTQRNERYFERPDQFEPERWQNSSIPKFAYFPFGGGAKMCIGDSFARMEGVLVLATIAREWRVLSDDPTPMGFNMGITLRPDRPVWMRPEARVVLSKQQ